MTEEQRIEVKTNIVCTILENWEKYRPNLDEEQLISILDVDWKNLEPTPVNMIDIGGKLLSKLVNDMADKIIERF